MKLLLKTVRRITISKLTVISSLLTLFCCLPLTETFAQLQYAKEPISYYEKELADPISLLQQRINKGEAKLEFDNKHGYLKSLLKTLSIPESSQTLVFSKTSMQRSLITPSSPRALYFNETVYIGWIPGTEILEVSSVDPQQGGIFFTLEQRNIPKPTFIRDEGNCLTCHASSRTQSVPGHLMRSVYPSSTGMPHYGSGTYNTDHTSPLEKSFGGWYVTGNHGKQRHMGNVYAKDRRTAEDLDVESGANVNDLSSYFDTSMYLQPTSDLIALKVLAHQTIMHNYITKANYDTRRALHDSKTFNKLLEREPDFLSESTQSRIKNTAKKVVENLLFVDEPKLTDSIAGNSDFTKWFTAEGPFDNKGRSLRQFYLQKRLFRFPCSFLIYSAAFQSLPKMAKDEIYQQLLEVLTEKNQDPDFDHLSKQDKTAILQILRDTISDFPQSSNYKTIN